MWIPLFRLLTQLSSRKFISRITGAFARSRFSRMLIPMFARSYQIDIQEAELPLEHYATLNSFFTRRLKPDVRVIDQTPRLLVSPVDAAITGMGPIENGQLLQVKGQDYTVNQLLEDPLLGATFANGWFFVLYLSPRDYHRIHAPIAGTVVVSRHMKGKVYPVNEFGLRQIKRVLSRNERLLTQLEGDAGEGHVAVIKVGAMNVSSIQYAHQPLPTQFERGEELAYFAFGSTVVLLTENRSFQPRVDLAIGSAVRMGEALGEFV